jgi:FkbM family methyltransferase
MLCKSDVEDDIAIYIKERVPKAAMRTVFDVGAYMGWFTYQFGKVFRDAEFYLFEPSPPIFSAIAGNLQRFTEYNIWPRVHAFPIALGQAVADVNVTAVPDVTVNKIVDDDKIPTERVRMVTGDGFCAIHRVPHIDYLKVDAEGYDLKVL